MSLALRRLAFLACILLAGRGTAAQPSGDPVVNRALGVGEAVTPEPFTLEQRFLDAARRGDRAALEKALQRGVDLEAKDDLGRSALLLAARDAGSLELMRLLHERGAKADVPDVGGRTALSWAAAAGRIDLVRELVGWGAVADRRDGDQRTPLFHAVLNDARDVVGFLLEHGADVNAADRFGDTPLMLACGKGFDALARLLLEHGADPALRDQEGRTARHRAAPGTPACLGSPPP